MSVNTYERCSGSPLPPCPLLGLHASAGAVHIGSNQPSTPSGLWGTLVRVTPLGSVQPFIWHSFDLNAELPHGWRGQIIEVADRYAVDRRLVPTSVTSREGDDVTEVPVSTVGGTAIAETLPWLTELYRTRFKQLAEVAANRPVHLASRDAHSLNINVQRGRSMRYECHVDSNPVEGLLYVTSHPPKTGGELVVANRGDVASVGEVDLDATRIYPVEGNLIFFDARRHSHYVAPLLRETDVRLVVAMNYYTDDGPESDRPEDLDQHLFGI